MTRRIAIAILFSVWVMLIIGGMLAYFTTRSILLADLDATIMNRALSRAVSIQQASTQPANIIQSHDRSITKNQFSQTIARSSFDANEHPEFEPAIISSKFSELADHRVRSLTIKYFAYVAPPENITPHESESSESPTTAAAPLQTALTSAPKPYTISYSQSAAQFDALLARLSLSLGIFGIIA